MQKRPSLTVPFPAAAIRRNQYCLMVTSGRESRKLIALISSIAQSVSIMTECFNLTGNGCAVSIHAERAKKREIKNLLIGFSVNLLTN
jgi:hypothetical protein